MQTVAQCRTHFRSSLIASWRPKREANLHSKLHVTIPSTLTSAALLLVYTLYIPPSVLTFLTVLLQSYISYIIITLDKYHLTSSNYIIWIVHTSPDIKHFAASDTTPGSVRRWRPGWLARHIGPGGARDSAILSYREWFTIHWMVMLGIFIVLGIKPYIYIYIIVIAIGMYWGWCIVKGLPHSRACKHVQTSNYSWQIAMILVSWIAHTHTNTCRHNDKTAI